MMSYITRFLFFTVFFIQFTVTSPIIAAPSKNAAILYNLNTGKILYEHNANVQIPPASLTKIMTMFLTFDAIKNNKISINNKIRINKQTAHIGGSTMFLRNNESVPIIRLLTGMAVASGNDAAMAIAFYIGKSTSKFVKLMNQKAQKLGLKNTVFKNPTGLPAQGQKTTAKDMLILSKAYITTHPNAMRFHSTQFFLHNGRVLHNTNNLLGNVSGVNGLKTGFTLASGYNIIITATRNKTKLLLIILGEKTKENRDWRARRILEAGFKYPLSPQKIRYYLHGSKS